MIREDEDTVDEQKIGEKSRGKEEDGMTKEQKRKDRHKSRKVVNKSEQKENKKQPKKSKSKYLHLREFLETRRQKRQTAGTLDPMAEVMMMI